MKRLAKLLILSSVLVLLACGRANDSDDSAAPIQGAPANVGVNSPSYADALYLENLSDLGACDNSVLHKLVYVQEDKQFHACAKSGWTIVDIKGKDGANGKDGISGINGVNGKDGKSANPINQYWQDPITGRNWFFGGAVTDTWSGIVIVFPSCPSGYALPNLSDAMEAWAHGIAAAMNAIQIAQSFRIQVDSSYNYGAYYNGGTNPVSISSQASAYNLACYK